MKERISGGKIDLEAIALGSVIPATQTEPLASAPLSFQPGDSLSTGVLEAFNPQKHLRPFKPEDLLFRQEVGQAPMVVPFSSILPDVEALWRKVASKHTNETIDLSEDIKTILQTASPILMPYYLIDFEDANPSYSGDPVSTLIESPAPNLLA